MHAHQSELAIQQQACNMAVYFLPLDPPAPPAVENPKSATRTVKPRRSRCALLSSTLDGFRSPCTMPSECRQARPCGGKAEAEGDVWMGQQGRMRPK